MLDLVIASLATWQIVEIWHHSELLAGPRARVETWSSPIADLLRCPFCLSPWIALIAVIALRVEFPEGVIWALISAVLKLPLWAFAVARLANLGNDLTRKICRTPKITSFLDEPDVE